ncbi:hypothetical protein BH23CHL7_BH23CHL7_06570 [soil metagenome]
MSIVGGRPIIDHVLERMRIGGASDLRVVVRPDKEDLLAHLRVSDVQLRLGQPATLSASFQLGRNGAAAADILLLGFPDTIWWPATAYRKVIATILDGAEIALGLFRTDEPERSEVVSLDAAGRLVDIAKRPRKPSSSWIWGAFAARSRAFDDLSPGDSFAELFLQQAESVSVAHFGRLLDIGTPAALARVQREVPGLP